MKETYKPIVDEELARWDFDVDDARVLLEQARRSNALLRAIDEMEREWANPVPCHVMRRKTREDVFKAARHLKGEEFAEDEV